MCDNPSHINCMWLFALLRSEPHPIVELMQPELLDISLWINREFAPRFSTPMVKNERALSFAAQELLSISAEISREFSPLSSRIAANLVLLPIDPRHLYAYWRIEQRLPSEQLAFKPPEPLTLRIFTQPSGSEESAVGVKESAWFDFPINSDESHQAVELPVNTAFSGAFSAALGVPEGEQNFIPLLVSNCIEMPTPGEVDAAPDQEKAVLSSALAQFIIPAAPGSSPARKSLC